jgi:hypothetical protein
VLPKTHYTEALKKSQELEPYEELRDIFEELSDLAWKSDDQPL